MAAAPPRVPRSDYANGAEPLRILQTAMEAGVLGFGAWRAVERLVEDNRIGLVVDVLDGASSDNVALLWDRVTAPEVVRQLTAGDAPDFVTIERLLPRLRMRAFEPLLDPLAASAAAPTRRGLPDGLAP